MAEQAVHLARRERKRPRQASLRRSVSASYYALFHLLSLAAVQRMASGSSSSAQHALRRSLRHDGMAKVCRAFTGAKEIPPPITPFVPSVVPPDLAVVAKAFIQLQEARHAADYDLALPVSRNDALLAAGQAKRAMGSWSTVRRSPEAANFLAALVIAGR